MISHQWTNVYLLQLGDWSFLELIFSDTTLGPLELTRKDCASIWRRYGKRVIAYISFTPGDKALQHGSHGAISVTAGYE